MGKQNKARKKAFTRRSKTGCLTCRKRRIKCDETRPMCRNCVKPCRNCIYRHGTAIAGQEVAQVDYTQNNGVVTRFLPTPIRLQPKMQPAYYRSLSRTLEPLEYVVVPAFYLLQRYIPNQYDNYVSYLVRRTSHAIFLQPSNGTFSSENHLEPSSNPPLLKLHQHSSYYHSYLHPPTQ